ncbi:Branched-chain-amino-acid aminotransferase [subsurface metagenome]
MTNSFHYGNACFEGIRGNWNSEKQQIYLFRQREHYQRLLNGCKILKINLPYSLDELCQITVQVVEKCDFHEEIYVRPVLFEVIRRIKRRSPGSY